MPCGVERDSCTPSYLSCSVDNKDNRCIQIDIWTLSVVVPYYYLPQQVGSGSDVSTFMWEVSDYKLGGTPAVLPYIFPPRKYRIGHDHCL